MNIYIYILMYILFLQIFDTFSDVINQEKIDRWIAPVITSIALTKNKIWTKGKEYPSVALRTK